MSIPAVTDRLAALAERLSADEYNYEHFRAEHIIADTRHTLAQRGIAPGEPAPDFELPQADGGRLQLSGLRGWPVLLHFGSYT